MTGLHLWSLIALILAGVIVANLIVNPGATKTLTGSITALYKWAVNSMMGGTS